MTLIYFSHFVQDATRDNSHTAYEKFVESAWESTRQCTLRGQFEFVNAETPVNIDEVEPAKNIVKRFCTGMIDNLLTSEFR